MTVPCGLIQNARPLDRSLFDMLHPQGRQLISGWAARGGHVRVDADASAYFEGFIFLWFAVNGWGACVTGTDTDREWVDAVAGDKDLATSFADSLRTDAGFADAGLRFAELWPIFRSSEIRRRGIWLPSDHTRAQRVQTYLENGISYEPSCWRSHTDRSPPMDWTHTFKTLYRVRCNLFHGEKTLDSENDRSIVQGAYPILVETARLLGLTP